MSVQSDYLRLYAAAWRHTQDARYLDAAKSIRRYVKNFLTSPDGVFYVSQDAGLVQGEHSEDYFRLDDTARRALGVPRVDAHVYSRENGWMILALAPLAQTGADDSALEDAINAARWTEKNRGLPGGGFRHDGKDSARPYLDDNLAMARAYLALCVVSAERQWLSKARRTEPGILLAGQEMCSDPTRITVVGTKCDAAASALYRRALAFPAGYRRIDWWDRAEGELTNADVAYPKLAIPAAFICTDKICSSPIFDPEEIAPTIFRLSKGDSAS